MLHPSRDFTNNSRRDVSFSLERCHAGGTETRELFIFDDIRPDASDKSVPPICRLRNLTFYSRRMYFEDRSSVVIHPTRVIPHLCPDNFFARSIATFPRSFRSVLDSGTASTWQGGGVITQPSCRAWSRILAGGTHSFNARPYHVRLHARRIFCVFETFNWNLATKWRFQCFYSGFGMILCACEVETMNFIRVSISDNESLAI